MLSNYMSYKWGSYVYKQWPKSRQSWRSYTAKTIFKSACAQSSVLATAKPASIPSTFHYQNKFFISVPELVVHTIHRTYYNNN